MDTRYIIYFYDHLYDHEYILSNGLLSLKSKPIDVASTSSERLQGYNI